jgi:hypothetical protein
MDGASIEGKGEEREKAAFVGDVEAIERLLDAGANIDSDGRIWNALHAAIEISVADRSERSISTPPEFRLRTAIVAFLLRRPPIGGLHRRSRGSGPLGLTSQI